MKAFRYSSGFALVTTIVMTGVAAILVAGVIGYVSWTVRSAAIYTGRDVCRLAAQSEIEVAKTVVNTDSMDVSLSELREFVMDREASRAGIHGVAKSRTRLSD